MHTSQLHIVVQVDIKLNVNVNESIDETVYKYKELKT